MNKLENQNTEYKESWRDEYLRWICGFANAQGGILFYLAGFIEAWGRGYSKIHDCFAAANLSQPTFEQVRGGVMATIQREKFIEIQGLSKGKEKDDDRNVAHDVDRKEHINQMMLSNPTENPTENYSLTQLEKKIVLILRKNPTFTQKQIAEEVKVGYTKIREYIVKLRKKGLLTRIKSRYGNEFFCTFAQFL